MAKNFKPLECPTFGVCPAPEVCLLECSRSDEATDRYLAFVRGSAEMSGVVRTLARRAIPNKFVKEHGVA